jgi:hypothetical protein
MGQISNDTPGFDPFCDYGIEQVEVAAFEPIDRIHYRLVTAASGCLLSQT